MLERVLVPLRGRQYESIVEYQILPRTGELVRKVLPPSQCAVITDSQVAPLYADVVRESLDQAGFKPTVIAVPAGEESKSMARVEALCDQMIEAGLDRSAFVAALGGGVIGDLAGFVASIYYRGIPYVQIPTTVVAQVDSAIGGKTGVNAREGKNLIGSFHQPVHVITDPAVLATLPAREFNEGIAEIVKHGVIRDAAMLDDLPQMLDSDPVGVIARNQQIKAQFVSEDEFEKFGLRALLNFGHTIGHAIENAAGLAKPSAAGPASISTRRISSVAYATEESASEDSTASPVMRVRRSCSARWDGIGRPTTTRLTCEMTPTDIVMRFRYADGVS